MRIHFIQQDSWVLPGEYLAWAERHSYDVTVTKCWEYESIPESADADMLVVLGGCQCPATTKEECGYFDAEQEKTLIRRYVEGLDADTQYVLEVAAITHDIACPLCRRKYGNTNGKHQEEEGARMVRAFLSDCGMSTGQVDRVAYLVGHHHTFRGIDGIDYQILIEADYIANASENGYSRENVMNFMNKIMKTESGKNLIKAVFVL